MGKIGNLFTAIINVQQIKALLWKDLLVRFRQPWMTAIQYIWPCLIFMSLYSLTFRFHSTTIDKCQFPTRQLPSRNKILPFFQSYICTIDNACSSTDKYSEISAFEDAPLTPVLNIVQLVLSDATLFQTITELPNTMNIVGAVVTIATHSQFSYIEDNINIVIKNLPDIEKKIGSGFDITKLWGDYRTFAKSGTILCGKPFPSNDYFRYVEDVLNQSRNNTINQDELDAMPTPYCKQLFLDVTKTENGKITWNQIKPVIQGKIIYGPANDLVNEIMLHANETFEALKDIKVLIESIDTLLTMIKTSEEFGEKINGLLRLAESPFVKSLIKSYSFDTSIVTTVIDYLKNDNTVSNIIETISNILECFSVDRFIPVDTEEELERLAYELNAKKLFYSAVYFQNDTSVKNKEVTYKIRMDIDNTAMTAENRQRFWFPGPNGNFELDMKYHRGFIQIQHAVDRSIIRVMKKNKIKNKKKFKAIADAIQTTTPTPTAVPILTTTTDPKPITKATRPSFVLVPPTKYLKENNITLDSLSTTTMVPELEAETVRPQKTINTTELLPAIKGETIAAFLTNDTGGITQVNATLPSNTLTPTNIILQENASNGNRTPQGIVSTSGIVTPQNTVTMQPTVISSNANVLESTTESPIAVLQTTTAQPTTIVQQPTTIEPKIPTTTLDPEVIDILNSFSKTLNISNDDIKTYGDDAVEDFLDYKDSRDEPVENLDDPPTTVANDQLVRRKRSPQFDGLKELFFGNKLIVGEEDDENNIKYDIDNTFVYTKQFPYPKYTKDEYVTALYFSQGIQLAFFFALIFQIGSSVRNRIWNKESGNSTLMRIMGLKKSSEYISWTITTVLEISLTFFLCSLVLYFSGTIKTTNLFFLYFYLFIFGLGVVSFSYMMSTIFSSATVGSVTSVIFFLATFMPFVVVVAHGVNLSFVSKFIANMSISTAFSYAWQLILLYELQEKELSFENAFNGSMRTNDIKFSIYMILIDTVLYAVIGVVFEYFRDDEFTFHTVPLRDMDSSIGATMNNVSKSYGEIKAAISNVTIFFRRDYITCLLGRNGAGKSTIIKLLTGQILPSAGSVYLPKNLDKISGSERKDKVGLCPQGNVIIPNLTPREHLQLYASIKLKDGHNLEVKRIMKNLDFGKHANFRCENLSGGFKRRLNIAIAFIGSPNLVILDEPCSGVDTKARKNIWDLIRVLRTGRAVILATHYLDEAEHLSDSILILNSGVVVAENNPDTLKDQFTKSFEMKIRVFDSEKEATINEIKDCLEKYSHNFNITEQRENNLDVNVPYYNARNEYTNFAPLIRAIEDLQIKKQIQSFRIISKDLEGIFNNLNKIKENSASDGADNGYSSSNSREYYYSSFNELESQKTKKINDFDFIKNLFWKRFVHFKRNYRLILCVLVLPAVFEIVAMACMSYRPPDDFGKNLKFSTQLYNSTEFFSMQNENDFGAKVYDNLHCTIENNCKYFNTSENAFKWVLNTTYDYIQDRYGGLTFNDTNVNVWYENNGYHSMPVYLNELNSALFKAELDDSAYKITTFNHPLQLGRKELTISSILQQVADAGISVVLLIAFSLVVAGASVYVVSERVNGEKLQQKLCGVTFRIYWGVAFIWDMMIFCLALLIAYGIFKAFAIPVYTDKENLTGICILLFMFGFATIPLVHLCEKMFTDASYANMYMLCLNVTVAISTLTTIIMFDIIGESDQSKNIRNFLNRLFLIFPQHALADGLLEICQNYIIYQILDRFYINTYKSPLSSDLLVPHIISLFLFGIVFIILNYLVEGGFFYKWSHKIRNNRELRNDLCTVRSMSNTSKEDKYDLCTQDYVMKVHNLCKTYNGNHQALNNVSFHLSKGECFGLLGSNGAGKSTIFSILSGQLYQTSGTLEFFNKKEISYCPQTNALDNLLTVKEVIHFYGTLRKISNLKDLTAKTLKSFHLEQYKNILVSNLSGGNRRKLSVAVTCFGDSSLVLMDEPTSDMDPVTRSLVYKSINDLLLNKRSVVLTSHTISEIDRVCSSIGVLREGKMISIGSPSALKSMYGNSYLVTIFYDQIESLSIERDLKKAILGIENFYMHNHCLQFTIKIKLIQFKNNKELVHSSGCISLSDLFNKLHNFTSDRNIVYTITECLLDQAFERVLETDTSSSYSNPGFQFSETST